MGLGLMGKLCHAWEVHGGCDVFGVGGGGGLVVLKPCHWGNPGFGAGDEVITRLHLHETEKIFLC